MMVAAPLLRPLPRRPMPTPVAADPRLAPAIEDTRWRLLPTLARCVQWGRFSICLAGRLLWDRVQGRSGPRQTGRRLRSAFEEMGGPAIKVGQQLSIRVDLLPFELCAELALLTDRVRPFPAALAIAEIEGAIGGPLHSVFAEFDPDPIGSASIACVYQGVLRSGERVAVKVRRPGIAEQFAADLALFGLATRILEGLTIFRPGFFRFIRQELHAMFMEELDFTREARFQSLFRQYIERDGIDWLTCPRLWRQWCNARVLVAEFIDGVPAGEVVAAVETADQAALARLAALGIDPRRVGLRVLQLGFWSNFEAPFVHGDPHPANLMVLPGSRLCLLDFGACSMRSRRAVVHQRQLIDHMVADRVSEMTGAALADLSPLPAFDADAFSRDLEAKILRFQCGLRDPTAPWFERTSASLWIHLLEVSRRYMLQVNLDTLRAVRASLLYDTLASRLNPRLSLAVTRRYLEQAPLREARRDRTRRRRNRAGGPPGLRAWQGLHALNDQLRIAGYRIDTLTLGVLPSLHRLADRVIRVGRWALAWTALILAGSLVVEPTPGLLLGISLVVSVSALRLARRLAEVG